MVKKTKGSSKPTPDRSDLAASVKASAQQIWLAGMGAFAKAQEEGTKVFSELVREGKNLQGRTQGMAEEKISEVTSRMSAMADTVQNRAGQNWDKLEGIFEQRTAKAMGKLGVPTARELDALTRRVVALEDAVARMTKATATPAPAPRATATTAPKAASKAAARKPPARAPRKRSAAKAA